MKSFTLLFMAGLASLFLLLGCGEKRPTEAELKNELAEAFHLGSGGNQTPVQRAAQEVVELMDAGRYGAAVRPLHGLMNAPDISTSQRTAAVNAMAEVQWRLASDRNLSEEERQEAQDSVNQTVPTRPRR